MDSDTTNVVIGMGVIGGIAGLALYFISKAKAAVPEPAIGSYEESALTLAPSLSLTSMGGGGGGGAIELPAPSAKPTAPPAEPITLPAKPTTPLVKPTAQPAKPVTAIEKQTARLVAEVAKPKPITAIPSLKPSPKVQKQAVRLVAEAAKPAPIGFTRLPTGVGTPIP